MRTYQFIEPLAQHGIHVDVEPLFSDEYLQGIYSGSADRARQGSHALLRRIGVMLRAGRYDLAWIEKEALPYMPWIVEGLAGLLLPPFIADYDDALFHLYDQSPKPAIRKLLGRKIDKVMAASAAVVAGNRYLADRAAKAGAKRIEIIPTVLDPSRYKVSSCRQRDRLRIGWIGTPMTAPYLRTIAPALARAQTELGAQIALIGSGPVTLPAVSPEIIPWTETSEAANVASLTVGIMPLLDTPWERGKCGYKLLQYMASGKPVIASPVGANNDIVRSDIGFLARSNDEWFDAFSKLAADPGSADAMGVRGRKRVEEEYSIEAAAPRIASLIHSLSKGRT